jgi:hypothetical protein
VDVLPGPVVIISGPELEVLDRQVRDAIRLGYTARGRHAPDFLLQFAMRLNRAAGGSGSSASRPWPGPLAELAGFREWPAPSSSGQPVVTLTVREAANLAGTSEGFMRRACRRGDVQASRAGPKGAWAVDFASLAVYASRRHRKEDDHREAALCAPARTTRPGTRTTPCG